MTVNEVKTLISAENTVVLWAIMTSVAALSIYLEQKYEWASRVSGAIIALVGALILSNFNIIPTDAPAYDTVWSYIVPVAIPLLLFKCDMRKIGKDSGRLLVIFLIGSVGTVLGTIIAFFALHNQIPDLYKASAMMAGSYIGGSVNLVAMSAAFEQTPQGVAAITVADNLLMAIYFFMLIGIAGMRFFRSMFRHPHIKAVESATNKGDKTIAATYWGRSEISLKDIAFCVGISFVIFAVSTVLATYFGEHIPKDGAMYIVNMLLGSKYLLLTTFTMIIATFFSKQIENVKGSQEIGTYLIYIFFVVIGVPASIPSLLKEAPLLFVFCAIIVLVNMVVSFGVGLLANFDLEEIIIASNANIGGPTTAAAMAISKGWDKLVAPAMLVGVLGYIIGNYAGIIVGNYLSGF